MQKSGTFTRALVVIMAVSMFLVLLAGSIVTKTESGLGCGRHWPLCNGKFVPAYTIQSAFEYSHRLISGIVGLLVLAVFILVLVSYRKRKDIVLYISSALFFTLVQAALGAMAVVWGQSAIVRALHFGISLFALAGTMLTAIAIWRVDRPTRKNGWGELYSNDIRVGSGFKWLVWGTLIYAYIVVYLGAYVRHLNAMGACEGWPTCNGSFVPSTWDKLTIVAYSHRVAAGIFLLVVLALAHFAYRKYGEIRVVRLSGLWILALTLAQIFSGAWIVNVLENKDVYLFAALTHSTIISALFGVLCYLSIVVWQLGGRTDVPKS